MLINRWKLDKINQKQQNPLTFLLILTNFELYRMNFTYFRSIWNGSIKSGSD